MRLQFNRLLVMLFLALNFQAVLAANDLFFDISVANNVLSIRTTIPNHFYSSAGIRLNTTDYSLANTGRECSPLANGYCIFSLSDVTPASISIAGATGTVSLTLCLNGLGELSCQNYTVTIISPPQIPTIYVSAFNGNVDISTNLGNTWTPTPAQPDGTDAFGIFVIPNGTMYVATQMTVEISSNNGLSWTATNPPSVGGVDCVFVSQGIIYTAAFDTVYFSSNNGNTWTSTNPVPDASGVFSLFIIPNGTIYAGTDDGNLVFSSNQGQTWTTTATSPDGSRVGAIFITPTNTLYVGTGNGNLEISTNNGTTWTPTISQPDLGCGINGVSVTTNGTIYASTGCGNVVISTDNGNTWTATPTQPPGSVSGMYVKE